MQRLTLFVLLATSAMFAQAYKAAPGPSTVETRELILHDIARHKDIPLKVLFPRDIDGHTPVIIFSHGAGGSKDSYSGLTRHWASYGYVVMQPSHDDSIALRREEGEPGDNMRGALQTALHDESAWQNRPRDISFIIDSFDEIEHDVPELRHKLDRDHIGVAGHSFGGFTAESSSCATIKLSGGQVLDLHDKRIKAALVLSGEGPGEMGFYDGSFKHCDLPMMSMTGTRDRAANGWTPEWREQIYSLSPSPDKYFLNLRGASHFTFVGRTSPETVSAGGQPGPPSDRRSRRLIAKSAPDETQLFGYVQVASTAFWDAYLMRDAAALNYLRSNELPHYAAGELRYARK
jgi:predicted dienelactone hydrolase